jgi:hypothetical protein
MPLYRWANSDIASMECIPQESGGHKSVLRISQNADATRLATLHERLLSEGIRHFTGFEDGTMTLTLPEVKDEKKLLSLVSQTGVVQGQAQTIETPADKEAANAKGGIKKNALFLSALFYDLGNAAFVVSGIQRGRHNRDGKFTPSDISEIMIGVSFAVGDLLMTFYGHEKEKNPLTAYADALEKHLKKQGIEIPRGAGMTPETVQKSGFFEGVHHFLQENITVIKCMAETVGGSFMIKAGLKRGEENYSKVAAGMLLATGWLSTGLLSRTDKLPFEFKDKTPPEGRTVGGAAYHWLEENPRGRIAGPLSMGNNILNLVGSYFSARDNYAQLGTARANLADTLTNHGEASHAYTSALGDLKYQEGKKHDYLWNVLSSCSFLIANSLFGLSGAKKDAAIDTGSEAVQQELLNVSANVLSNIPEKARNYAVMETAAYVSRIKGIALTPKEIAQEIHTRIDEIQRTPFVTAPVQAAAGMAR